MLIALLSTILSSFWEVSWKKSLTYWIRTRAHALWSYPIALALLAYFILTGFDLFSVWIVPVIIISIIAILDIIKEPVDQQIYKEEKISVIMPYLNLSKIFVIISSFFIYKDVSNFTFCITIITIIIIILASIDTKNKRLPRNFSKLLFVETMRTIGLLLWGWLVLSYSEIVYFNVYVLAYLIPTLFLVFTSGQVSDLIKASPIFWFYRLLAAMSWLSWFLSLVVIKNLGLSLSILLWFLWIWVTLLVSYFFLKDVPSKKNILLTITVSVLIWIWYYFK